MRTNNFDPLAYIESAFLDAEIEEPPREERMTPDGPLSVEIPSIADYLGLRVPIAELIDAPLEETEAESKARFRKVVAPTRPAPMDVQSAEGFLRDTWIENEQL